MGKDITLHPVENPLLREIIAELEHEENNHCSDSHVRNWSNWVNWTNWVNWNNWTNWYNWWT